MASPIRCMPLSHLDRPVRITDHAWPDGTPPLVSILCAAFNHAQYIGECLDGFLKQETTFPVEIIIHDDASTDGTQDVVNEFRLKHPKLIKVVFQQQNQYALGRRPALLALPFASGSLIATCEGDDYWTLPSKLQDQVEIFQAHPECILCGGRVAVQRDSQCSPYRIEPGLSPEELAEMAPSDMLSGRWMMRTLSRVARREIWDAYLGVVQDNPVACDWLFTLYCISVAGMDKNAFKCLDKVVGIYREHPGGVWFSASEDEKLRRNLTVVTFALTHFNFAYRPAPLEAHLVAIIDSLKPPASQFAEAYAIYERLEQESRRRSCSMAELGRSVRYSLGCVRALLKSTLRIGR